MNKKESRTPKRTTNNTKKNTITHNDNKQVIITSGLLYVLFAYVAKGLETSPCDNTHRLTREFLEKHNIPVMPVLKWLMNNGGYCDCEVLMNVTLPDQGREVN